MDLGDYGKYFSFFILKYLESISNVAFVTSFIFLIQFVIQIYIYIYIHILSFLKLTVMIERFKFLYVNLTQANANNPQVYNHVIMNQNN